MGASREPVVLVPQQCHELPECNELNHSSQLTEVLDHYRSIGGNRTFGVCWDLRAQDKNDQRSMQGLKAVFIFRCLAARVNSCPCCKTSV